MKRLGGLRIQYYILGIVKPVKTVKVLHHDSLAVGLTHKSVHLGVTSLAVYHNLLTRLAIVVGRLYAALQMKHHRTGSVDYVYVVALCEPVSRRRFAVGPQQHLHSVKRLQVVVGYRDKSALSQSLHLVTVVHDVTKAI